MSQPKCLHDKFNIFNVSGPEGMESMKLKGLK